MHTTNWVETPALNTRHTPKPNLSGGLSTGLSIGLLAALVALAGGCKGSGSPARGTANVNTGLSALASGSSDGGLILEAGHSIDAQDPGALALQAAVDLESLLKSGELDPSRRSTAPRTGITPDPGTGLKPAPMERVLPAAPTHIPLADGDALAEADQAWNTLATDVPSTGDPAQPTAEPKAATTEDRLVALASRIASFIREPVNGTNGSPAVAEAVVLAPLEALAPGSLASIDDPKSVLGSRLSTQDRRTLAEARDRMASSPRITAETIAESLRAIAPPTAVRIPRALLATRVSGFGKFEPFESNRFMAGTPARAIVYAEIDGFTYRAAKPGDPIKPGDTITDQQAVELEQTLTLYQDIDGYQAWHKPAQRVTEVSRTRRRDFYLIQVIDLPAALSIGKYNLKITIRDVTSGAVAESVIPIEFRASLASAE